MAINRDLTWVQDVSVGARKTAGWEWTTPARVVLLLHLQSDFEKKGPFFSKLVKAGLFLLISPYTDCIIIISLFLQIFLFSYSRTNNYLPMSLGALSLGQNPHRFLTITPNLAFQSLVPWYSRSSPVGSSQPSRCLRRFSSSASASGSSWSLDLPLLPFQINEVMSDVQVFGCSVFHFENSTRFLDRQLLREYLNGCQQIIVFQYYQLLLYRHKLLLKKR